MRNPACAWPLMVIPCWFGAIGGCQRSNASEGLPSSVGSLAIPEIPSATARMGDAGGVDPASWVTSGTAAPLHEAKLGPKASGVIAAIYVEEGDKVKRGQVLFRLDASTIALGIAQAQAALSSAVIARNVLQTDWQRTQALFDRGSIAPALLDQVKARYDGAKAAVEQAQAALNSARKVTADTAVVSPLDGVVASRRAGVGDTVTMMPPTIVLVVQDNSSLEIRARVAETMLKTLRPGRLLRIHFPSVETDRVVPIERINPSVDPMTRTIEVVALVPNQDGALKAGMLVQIDFGGAEPAPSQSAAESSAMVRRPPLSNRSTRSQTRGGSSSPTATTSDDP